MRMKMDKRTVSQGPALLWVCSVVVAVVASQLRVERASRHSFDLVADVFINCGNLCAF